MNKIPFLLLSSAALAGAQDLLKLNQSVAHELAPDATQRYEIQLGADDIAAGSVEQRGKVEMTILFPDGSLLRRFPGGPNDGKRPFAFVAETPGTYRLELSTTATEPVRYELRLEEILPLQERLKSTAPPEKYVGSKITELRKRVAGGAMNTEAFWKEVAASGTPLVEPAENDPKRQLVTFLWRGNANTRNVLVYCSCQITGAVPLDYAMHRLAQTDVWYLTLRLPTGARFAYQLSPNDPLRFDGPQPQRQATTQADPLNPHRWACQPGASKFARQSMAELPGAVPQPWIVKNQKRASEERTRSFHLHTSRVQGAGRPLCASCGLR